MNDSVIIGGLVLAGAAVLLVYQLRTQSTTTSSDAWLHTPSRHRRRMTISGVLALIGLLIIATGTSFLPLEPTPEGTPRIGNLAVFLVSVMTLSILLIALALLDFRETTRAVARHAVAEFGDDHPFGDGSDPSVPLEERPIPTTKSSSRLRRAPDRDAS